MEFFAAHGDLEPFSRPKNSSVHRVVDWTRESHRNVVATIGESAALYMLGLFGIAMWASSGNHRRPHSLQKWSLHFSPWRFTWQCPGGNPSSMAQTLRESYHRCSREAVVPWVFTERHEQILHDATRACLLKTAQWYPMVHGLVVAMPYCNERSLLVSTIICTWWFIPLSKWVSSPWL